MRRPTRLVLLAAVMVMAMALALPAAANRPENYERPDFIVVHDFQHSVVVLWNTTQQAYCDWLELGGNPEDPPGLTDLEFTFVQAANGYSTTSYQQTGDLEIWEIFTGNGDDVCTNAVLWAEGEATASLRDVQDPDTVGTFLSTIHAQGKVTEIATGDVWRYSWRTLVSIDETGPNHLVQEFTRSLTGN